jgi:hypothetical protein
MEVGVSKLIARLGALLLCGSLGAVMAPGCVIRIGPEGGEDDPAPDPSGGADSTEGPSSTPEQRAAEEGLAQADPQEVALLQAKAGYMAYIVMGTIEAQGYDPEIIDAATLNQLVTDLVPWASDAADDWIATQDVNMLVGEYKPTPRYECNGLFGCPFHTKCPGSTLCIVTDCDSGNVGPVRLSLRLEI